MAEDERPDAPQDEQVSGGDAGAPTDDASAGQPAAEASADEPTAADAPTAPEAAEPADSASPEPAAPAAAADEPGHDGPSAPSVAPTAAAPAEEAAAPAEEAAAPEAAAPAETPADDPAEPASAEEAQSPAAADATPAGEQRRQRPPRADEDEAPAEPTAVPGAHLEPDLVLEAPRAADEGEVDPYATDDDSPIADGEQAATVEETPAHTPLDLAADARYPATGKRKRAVARVILRPGQGVYTINGKELDTYFPRITLQKSARLPLETAGYETRMDVVAKIHGGGVSSQAIALRHGIARALVEADPNLRGELKRHGFLTRDARVKERKKAGLKKARKRPQFSKR